MSRDVVICECFARDGLQNQDAVVPTDLKVQFIDAATEAGFAKIEAASYAHPKYLPQFADTEGTYPKVMGLTGNACMEDLVAMLEEIGVRTGIELDRLLGLGRLAEGVLGRELLFHVVKTGLVMH